MFKPALVLQWTLLILVVLLTAPVAAEIVIEVIDSGKGQLSPGGKLDYFITTGEDPTDVDLYLFNTVTDFSALVEQNVAPEQNGTFMGNFRLAIDTPPGTNYTLAVFQISSQVFLAFSKSFEIFPLPIVSAPPDTPRPSAPISSTPQGPIATFTAPRPSVTQSYSASLPPTVKPSPASSRPVGIPSVSSGTGAQSTTKAQSTATGDQSSTKVATSAPAPTSPGRPPLDAGQDLQSKSAESETVNVPAIVGGTVGTVVAAAIAIWIFMCWRRYKRRLIGVPQPFPFLIAPPLRILAPPLATQQRSSSPSMHETSLYTIPESMPEPYFDDNDRQAEFLLRERQRIDEKLADLERNKTRYRGSKRTLTSTTSSTSPTTSTSQTSSGASSSSSSGLLEELNAMKEKVRQLEAARDANPPSFDENNNSHSQSSSSEISSNPATSSKAVLRSNSHSLFFPPPEYDTTSPIQHSSRHSAASKTQCYCRDCG